MSVRRPRSIFLKNQKSKNETMLEVTNSAEKLPSFLFSFAVSQEPHPVVSVCLKLSRARSDTKIFQRRETRGRCGVITAIISQIVGFR